MSSYERKFAAYLKAANATDVKSVAVTSHLYRNILAQPSCKPRSIRTLDIGSGNGELIQRIRWLLEDRQISLRITAVEPNECFQNQLKTEREQLDSIYPGRIQDYFSEYDSDEVFQLILFSQVWYHFPRSEWELVLESSLNRLSGNGQIIIILDSHDSRLYRFRQSLEVETERAEYGDFIGAEAVISFLRSQVERIEVDEFPVVVRSTAPEGREDLVRELAGHLSFLFRCDPLELTENRENRERLEEFLASARESEGSWKIVNWLKVASIR